MELNTELILLGSSILTIITEAFKNWVKRIFPNKSNLVIRLAMVIVALVGSGIYLAIKDSATFDSIVCNSATVIAGASGLWLFLVKHIGRK